MFQGRSAPAPAILVMGVCGVGKTTVARAIAESTGGRFIEADDHHSPENRRRMASGLPLTDAMRWPWLASVADACIQAIRDGHAPVTIACSALKRRYRQYLKERIGDLVVIHLHGDPGLIRDRMTRRKSHFMPVSLLESQLAELEFPDQSEDAATIDVAKEPEQVLAEAFAFYRRAGEVRSRRPGPRQVGRGREDSNRTSTEETS